MKHLELKDVSFKIVYGSPKKLDFGLFTVSISNRKSWLNCSVLTFCETSIGLNYIWLFSTVSEISPKIDIWLISKVDDVKVGRRHIFSNSINHLHTWIKSRHVRAFSENNFITYDFFLLVNIILKLETFYSHFLPRIR